MAGELIRDKKVKVFNILESSTQRLIETNNGIVITDLLISNTGGRLIFRINDGQNSKIFLEVKEGTNHFSFNNGLSFWEGANLEVIKELSNYCVVTVGYYINQNAKDYSVWNL